MRGHETGDQRFAPHCPGGCAVAASYIGGLSAYSSCGDSIIGAGMGGVGSRGPRGLVGEGMCECETAVSIWGGGAAEGAEDVVYTEADGAGDPLPYCGYEFSAGTTLSPYPPPPSV